MIHPDIHRFLKDWEAAWATLPAGAGPAARRAHFEVVAAKMREPHPAGISTQDHWVAVPETGQPVRVPLTNPIGCNVKWDGEDAHWMPAEACDLVFA